MYSNSPRPEDERLTFERAPTCACGEGMWLAKVVSRQSDDGFVRIRQYECRACGAATVLEDSREVAAVTAI